VAAPVMIASMAAVISAALKSRRAIRLASMDCMGNGSLNGGQMKWD
jgi:hypothetical protein